MELREQLKEAIEYATETGSFHKRNLIEKAEHVCVYGLGKYFEDAFIRQHVKERFAVDFLCDSNFEKVEMTIHKPDYAGLRGITFQELGKLKNVYVIVMLGNPENALIQIGKLVGPQNCAAYNDVALDDVVSSETIYRSRERFIGEQENIFHVFEMLTDEKSKWVYVNTLSNRIAPQFSQVSYKEMFQEPQYFPEDVFTLTESERVIDGGAYTGDTCESFLKICRENFESYHCFEMDHDNYRKLLNWRAGLDKSLQKKIFCHEKGLWDKKQKIFYGRNASDDSYSIYNTSDICYTETETLDDFLKDKEATLIKMDIEGAELKALAGGKDAIAMQKPKMAICAYHRVEDMWKIPLCLKQFVPEYKIAIRHHAKFWVSETVCYGYL